MKDADPDELLDTALRAKIICRRFGARLIINDHVALTLAMDADGVHLGKEDLPPKVAREILGTEFMIGATANTMEDMEKANAQGVDYIGLGPFKHTTTKENLSPVLGLEGITALVNQCKEKNIATPVFAIGGIEKGDIPMIMAAGVHGIAASGMITQSTEKQDLVKEIKQVIQNAAAHDRG